MDLFRWILLDHVIEDCSRETRTEDTIIAKEIENVYLKRWGSYINFAYGYYIVEATSDDPINGLSNPFTEHVPRVRKFKASLPGKRKMNRVIA